MDESAARRAIKELVTALETLVQSDPEQEIQGSAIHTLDAVIVAAKRLLPGHPVVESMPDVISPEAVSDAEAIRAADALIQARQLLAAIGPAKPRVRYISTAGRRRIPGL